MTTPTPPQMTVALYDGAYRPRGRVADYISCSVTWNYLAVGSGALAVDESNSLAPLLLSCAKVPIEVVATVAGQRWSGRVASATLERTGKPGTGVVRATLVDDWAWLRAMLASQNGADPALTGMPQFDTETGPAATVAAYYINAAAQRLSLPVVAVTPVGDSSSSITLSARMTPLADLLTTPLSAAGVALPASVWLPGDLQPLGLTLQSPTIVFTPGLPPSKPWLRWSDGGPDGSPGMAKIDLTVTAGTAYRMVLGLDGQDAARNYDGYIDPTQQQLYALPEAYADESSVTLGAGSQAQAASDLTNFAPSAAAAFQVVDGVPFFFGKHYLPGDLATFSTSGIDLADRITQVTATDDRNGVVLTQTIGDSSATATSDELLVAAISSIAQQVRALGAKG